LKYSGSHFSHLIPFICYSQLNKAKTNGSRPKNLISAFKLCTLLAVFFLFSVLAYGQGATPGTGSVTLAFTDLVGICSDSGPIGTMSITVNGFEDDWIWGCAGSTDGPVAQVAAEWANSINVNDPNVSATSSGPTIFLTARTAGSNTNYTLSTSAGGPQAWFTLSPSGSNLTGGGDAPIQGFINPKYAILAWTYAPPGSKSNVIYNNSQLVGMSVSISDSFTDQVTQSLAVSHTFGVPNVPAVKAGTEITTTVSNAYSEEQDSSNSVALSQTKTNITTIPGPASDAVGVNHDYDVVWLWLNPLLKLSFPAASPNSLTWGGFDYDADDIPEMDIYGVEMGWLNGHFGTIRTDIRQVLDRTWAAGQLWPVGDGPALTDADFAAIIKANPFSDPTYTVTVPVGSNTSSDGRFTVSTNQNVTYVPPGPGGNPTTQAYAANYSATESQGTASKYTLQTGFALEEKFTGSFIAGLTLDFKEGNTLTWTNQFSQTRTNTTNQTSSFSVTGPAASANYTGPTEFVVFQDNIYGTFMFYPVNQSPDFLFTATSSTQSVPVSGSAAYTVSTTAMRGFSDSVSLSVSGLPVGSSASFVPASLSGTGSSTLTVATGSNTAAGTYTLTISGSSPGLIHSTTVTLIVQDFSLAATPGSQTVLAPGSTNFTVSTAALSGFSSNISLSTGSLPTGVSATFTPTSVVAGGSSTLSLNATSSAFAGNYPITVFATSGSLTHSTQVNLTVTAPDFSISATPSAQTVTARGNTTYTVSTSALNSFTGSVSLGTSGLPTGATASFSPASISGSATSTLTISTLSSTPAATYTIMITGISGSINHSTAVLLTVNAPTGSVTISAPANNSKQSTSVRVTASATETGTQIAQMQVWDNTTGVRLGINNGSTIDQTYTLTPGTHQIIVEDLASGTFALIHTSSVTITVFADGVHITAPANNASITGPVHVTGFATEAATQIAQMQVWDNTTGVRLGINNGSTIDQTYTLAAGTHQIIMEDLAAGTFALIHTASVTVTVH
jgi:hypothetical protein